MSASAIPVTVRADDPWHGSPGAIEAALYFCCMEAVQNAAKHSGAGQMSVRLDADDEHCPLVVTDDGIGFERPSSDEGAGAGLLNMRDRLDSVGGTLTVASTRGHGTTDHGRGRRGRLPRPACRRAAGAGPAQGGLTCTPASRGRSSA